MMQTRTGRRTSTASTTRGATSPAGMSIALDNFERMGGNDSMTTYLVRRFCFNEERPEHKQVMASGLSLEEAREWCSDDATHGEFEDGTPWFDGYEEEESGLGL